MTADPRTGGRCFWNMPRWIGDTAIILFALAHTPAQATETYCAVTEKAEDGFVSLRVGPSTSYRAVSRVMPSDLLWVDTGTCRDFEGAELCDPTGRWVFVEKVFSLNERLTEHSAQGWINSHLIRQGDL